MLAGASGCGHGSAYYLDKGNALFAKADYAEAELNFRKATQKDPNNGEAFYRTAQCELKQNEAAPALQDLDQAVRLMPDNRQAKRDLANLALGGFIGDPSRPDSLYQRLIRMSDEWLRRDPQSAEGLRIKGYLAMVEKRPQLAVSLFTQAQQSNPKDERINMGLMDALYRNSEPLKAEKVGLDFIAANPNSGEVYDALFRMYLATKRASDAENILIRKVKNNPKQNSYLLDLASYYATTGRKSEMDNTMRTYLTNPGGDPQLHLKAGDFYSLLGQWSGAIEQYKIGIAANGKDKPAYQVRTARALIMLDKREEAIKVLSDDLAQHPEDNDARKLRAALMLGKTTSGKAGAGVADLKAMVEKNPDDALAKITYAKALLESGDLDGARMQFQDVVKTNPRFVDGYVALADIAFKQGANRDAADRAGDALRLDPNNLRARMLRGSALMRLGQYEEASEVLNRLNREYPKAIDIRLELGALAIYQKKYGDAEAIFKKIQDENPKDLRPLGGLVDTDLAQHRPDKALARLEDELDRSRGATQVRYMLAVTAMRTGKYGIAIEQFQKLADSTPGSIDPQLQLADALRVRGDVAGAITTLKKAAALAPNDARPATMLSFLYQTGNQRDQAKAEARRALQLRPEDPASMNNMAFALAEDGENLTEALKLARQATEKAPSVPYFADTLAYVYLRKDQNDQAMAILDKLTRKYPNNPDFAYHAGMAWYQMGQPAKAKTELARALDLSPSKETTNAINDLLRLIR
ncbi:MAG TPA: tetratricopeptide repeat protein [Bryobacteraceae bacterium]|nr:tetratricopeptide repeat protein [Bryobacteraceae bacterium]